MKLTNWKIDIVSAEKQNEGSETESLEASLQDSTQKELAEPSESDSNQDKTESSTDENSLEARLKSEQQQLTLDKLATDLNTTVESLKEAAEKHNIELTEDQVTEEQAAQLREQLTAE